MIKKNWKAIAAMSQNRVIGCGNQIPWHLPEDFKWFKKRTMGDIIVMGRKTFESIGKPLPGRQTILLSRQDFEAPSTVRVMKSLEALKALGDNQNIWICGGSEIYRQALPHCSELYLTLVKRRVQGDVYFSEFESQFSCIHTLIENQDFKILHYRNRGA